jgi:Protein of unknown function (DUF4197)
MKNTIVMTIIGISALTTVSCQAQQTPAGWGDVLNKAKGVLEQASGALSTDEIARGLKEALTVGIKNGSSLASALDGYYKNDAIKLLFPPEARKVEEKLRAIGLGSQCDQFVTTLNRGAEEAAKKATPIFVNAITSMSFSDALAILKGDKNAATQYLKRTTTQQLMAAYSPVMDEALAKTTATKYYTDLAGTYNKLPFVEKVNPDLKSYATQKAIDGLFLLVEQEEKKIRENPAARVTDLLKKVFSQQ